MDPLDPPHRFEPARESPLDKVLGGLVVVFVAVLWLRDPGDHLLQLVVAAFAGIAVLSVVGRRAPRVGVRLHLGFTVLLLVGGIVYVAWQSVWWVALIVAVILLPAILARAGALAYSFKHPEWLEED